MGFYEDYLLSPQWKEKRYQVLARAGGKCERCGELSDPLEVHHKHYDTLGKENLRDLEAVCLDCHPKADRERVAETQYERGLDTYATKKYGDDWQWYEQDIAEEFDEWLDRQGGY